MAVMAVDGASSKEPAAGSGLQSKLELTHRKFASLPAAAAPSPSAVLVL